MNLLLGKIRGRIPARFWPSGLLLSGENHGEICSRIVPRFWPLGFLLLSDNLGKIRSRFPTRFWPPGFLLSSENHGEICGRIAPRFWPPGFLLLGENLGEFRGRIPARFWPLGILLPGENLAGIPGRKILAAKISPGSWWDSHRDRNGIPPRSRSLFYKGLPRKEEMRFLPGMIIVTTYVISFNSMASESERFSKTVYAMRLLAISQLLNKLYKLYT